MQTGFVISPFQGFDRGILFFSRPWQAGLFIAALRALAFGYLRFFIKHPLAAWALHKTIICRYGWRICLANHLFAVRTRMQNLPTHAKTTTASTNDQPMTADSLSEGPGGEVRINAAVRLLRSRDGNRHLYTGCHPVLPVFDSYAVCLPCAIPAYRLRLFVNCKP